MEITIWGWKLIEKIELQI